MPPSKEYVHLFNAITRVIDVVRWMTAKQLLVCASVREATRDEPHWAVDFVMGDAMDDIAALQMLQLFLVRTQREAEDLYIDSAP